MTAPTSPRPTGFWHGTVTDVGPPLQVKLDHDAEPSPAEKNEDYAPTVGDRVLVVQVGAQLCAVCSVTQ